MAAEQQHYLTTFIEYPKYTSSEANRIYVVVRVKPPVAKDTAGKAPVCICAVLDKSGSMGGRKLNLVKATTKFLVNNMRGADNFGVVTFDSQVDELIQQERLSEDAKKVVCQQIDTIRSGSCTNLSGGLLKGIQQLQQSKVEPGADPVRGVMLFTDGLANEGIRDITQLQTTLGKVLDHPRKLAIHTFGYGSDHDEQFLNKVAEAANGTFYFIEKDDNIPEAFAHAVGSLMSVTAQNVEVVVQSVASGGKVELVNTGYNVKKEDASLRVALGDMYDQQEKEMLFQFDVPKCMEEGSQQLLLITLSFFDVESSVFVEESCRVCVERAKHVGKQTSAPDVLMAKTRLQTAEAMDKAVKEASRGRLSAGRNILVDQKAALKATLIELDSDDAHQKMRNKISAMIRDLERLLEGYETEARYDAMGRGHTVSITQAYSRGAQTQLGCAFDDGNLTMTDLIEATRSSVREESEPRKLKEERQRERQIITSKPEEEKEEYEDLSKDLAQPSGSPKNKGLGALMRKLSGSFKKGFK